uniref:Uncharacterized protein n=1 Tax=Arundo donax TaxID=35708 RepID=A0A0A9HAJ0_ARUDO
MTSNSETLLESRCYRCDSPLHVSSHVSSHIFLLNISSLISPI